MWEVRVRWMGRMEVRTVRGVRESRRMKGLRRGAVMQLPSCVRSRVSLISMIIALVETMAGRRGRTQGQ